MRRQNRERVWMPPAVLALALLAVFVFGGDREHFYRPWVHDWISIQDLALADSLFTRPFRFFRVRRGEDGRLRYNAYNRRPIGVFVLVHWATRPFAGDVSAQIHAARMLMLGLFAAAAGLAYAALVRITGDRWVATGATLLAFSSCYALGYADAIASEGSTVLFALLLAFHGMVVFADADAPPRRRFVQLLLKVCAALLLCWQVYGLLLPFVALGAGAAALRVWRQEPPRSAWPLAVRRREAAAWRCRGGGRAGRLRRRAGALAAVVFGSRHTVLAVVALLFGAILLGYNLIAEHSAYYGEKSIAELPSAGSALHRTGFGSDAAADPLLAPDFYRWQFHRLGVMAVPYAWPGLPPIWINHPLDPGWAQPRLAAVGIAVVATCLVGLLLVRRHRALLAVLLFGGFCWALPMRYETVVLDHDFEALAYIGVPLCFFTMLLLGVRRVGRWGPGVVAGLALAGAVAFGLSSKAMAAVGWSAEESERQRVLFQEFEAVREHARGRDVLVAAAPDAILYLVLIRRKFWYYMSGSVLQYQDDSDAHGHAADFVLSLERVPSDLLLTPSHRFVFLYRSLDAVEDIEAARRREYRRIATTEPVVRATWNVHVYLPPAAPASAVPPAAPASAVPLGSYGHGGREIAFLKAPCAPADAAGRFLVHVVPVDPQDLPAARRQHRFENLDFGFVERGGARFDGKCMVKIPLPEYEVAALRLGRFADGGVVAWQTRYDVRRPAG